MLKRLCHGLTKRCKAYNSYYYYNNISFRIYCRNRNQDNNGHGMDVYYNYYKDLGFNNLSKNKFYKITMNEIKQAYTKLIKEYHPDTNRDIDHKESVEKLDKLRKAYTILSNENLKREYDNFHRAPYRDIPFPSMRDILEKEQQEIREKEKEKKYSQTSFHEKLKDKTWKINYYADKHKVGGMKTNKVETNKIEYDNPENNTFNSFKKNKTSYSQMKYDNIWNINQQNLNNIGYFVMIGAIIIYLIYDTFNLTTNKTTKQQNSLDETDQAFIQWLNRINHDQHESSDNDQ